MFLFSSSSSSLLLLLIILHTVVQSRTYMDYNCDPTKVLAWIPAKSPMFHIVSSQVLGHCTFPQSKNMCLGEMTPLSCPWCVTVGNGLPSQPGYPLPHAPFPGNGCVLIKILDKQL